MIDYNLTKWLTYIMQTLLKWLWALALAVTITILLPLTFFPRETTLFKLNKCLNIPFHLYPLHPLPYHHQLLLKNPSMLLKFTRFLNNLISMAARKVKLMVRPLLRALPLPLPLHHPLPLLQPTKWTPERLMLSNWLTGLLMTFGRMLSNSINCRMKMPNT